MQTQRPDMWDEVEDRLSDGQAAAPPVLFIHELQTAVTALLFITLRLPDDSCGIVVVSVAFK